ncbi:MAG: ribonuclease P protein component [Verrucomicrobiales bacterium]|nr:ribonuclease P protein component [Verrucomicrobiales bacterium]
MSPPHPNPGTEPSLRLPARFRLKHSADFAAIRATRSNLAGRYLVLAGRRVENATHFQFGLITGRKIGPAVDRNRVRRRLREIIRHHQQELLPHWQWVVIARWRAAQASQARLEQDWLRLAQRLGILAPRPSP